LDIPGFLREPGSWRIVADLVGIGVFTGFFVVPLFALVQTRTPKDELSRTIGALNIQNSAFVVAASVTCLLLRQWAGWSIPQLFLALAVANTLVAAWIFSIVPEFLMRFLSWVLVRTLYRLRVRGVEEHVPDEGPAVLVCNHVSYVDALVLSAAIPRPVRWVMYHRIFDIPVLRWIFRNARAIPIAGAREDPALMQRAFDTIDAVLAEGELVGIFPEGALTKDGAIAPFKSGVERILARRPVPVVPLALRGLWASMWSRRDSRLGRMRVPRRFHAHVELHAGQPMPPTTTAADLEAQARQLRGPAEEPFRLPIPGYRLPAFTPPSRPARTAPAPPATAAGCARPGSSRRAARAVRPAARPGRARSGPPRCIPRPARRLRRARWRDRRRRGTRRPGRSWRRHAPSTRRPRCRSCRPGPWRTSSAAPPASPSARAAGARRRRCRPAAVATPCRQRRAPRGGRARHRRHPAAGTRTARRTSGAAPP